MNHRAILPLPEYATPDGRKHYRLRLELNDETEVYELADEQVTSGSETARPVRDGIHTTFVFDSDAEARLRALRWLHEQLGKALAMHGESTPPASGNGGADDPHERPTLRQLPAAT